MTRSNPSASRLATILVLAAALLPAALLARSGLGGAAAPARSARLVGALAEPIIAWEHDQVRSAAAAGASGAGGLVVWEDQHWAFGEARDVYGRLLSAQGAPAGEPFAVAWEGGEERLAPDVAALPGPAGYLVVWEHAHSEADHDIRARLVAPDGSLPGGELVVAQPGTFEGRPRVAHNADAGRSLVVWERVTGSSRLPNVDVLGQLLAADGSLVGGPIEIAVDAGVVPQGAPDVAALGGGFFVAWQDGGAGDFDVLGRYVQADGGLPAPAWPLSSGAQDQRAPRLAASSEAGELLAVWEDHRAGAGAESDIRGRRVASSGQPLGAAFGISWEDEKRRLAPDISFHPAASAYLVAWEREHDPSDLDLHARWVAMDGTLPGTSFAISQGGAREARPAAIAASAGAGQVVWEDGRNAEVSGLDLYLASLPIPPQPSPTPSPSTTRPPTQPPTAQPTASPSPTAPATATPTQTATSTQVPSASATSSSSPTSTDSPTPPASPTPLPSATPSASPSPPPSPSATRAPTDTPVPSPTSLPSATPTQRPSPPPSPVPSATPRATAATDEPAERRSVQGEVRLDGREAGRPDEPLSGVIVELYGAADEAERGRLLARARTGDEGRFYLAHLAPRDEVPRYYNVLLAHPGAEVLKLLPGSAGRARGASWWQLASQEGAELGGGLFYLSALPPPVPPEDLEPVPEKGGAGPGRSPIPPQRIEAIDFRVDGVELTQAIQCFDTSQGDTACPDNSLELVAGKLTAARVYVSRVGPHLGKGLYPKIRVDLSIANAGATDGGAFSAVGLVSQRAVIAEIWDRDKAETTVNFLIPSPQAGSLTAVARVNADGAWPDPNPANDESTPAVATVVEAREVEVSWMRMRYQPDASTKHAPYAGAALADPGWIQGEPPRILRWLFPTPGLRYQPRPNPLKDYHFELPVPDGSGKTVLTKLKPDLRDDYLWYGKSYPVAEVFLKTRLKDLFLAGDTLYSWFPAGAFAGASTKAMAEGAQPTFVGAGEVALGEASRPRLFAHEVAHNFGLGHFPCFLNPKHQHAWKAPYDKCNGLEISFDPARMQAVNSHTFMTYNYGATGIAPVEWRFLLDRLRTPSGGALQAESSDAEASSAAAGELRVAGLLSEAGGALYPLSESAAGEEGGTPPAMPGSSAAEIRLLDERARLIAVHPIPPSEGPADGSGEDGGMQAFDLALPRPEGLARIELRLNGRLLDALAPSALLPSLRILAPAAGQRLAAAAELRWAAEDGDGDPLSARIDISHDDGATWTLVAAHALGSALTIDTETLPGCEACLLRVRVSDGWHTTRAEIGSLRIDRKPPMAWIEGAGELVAAPDRLTVLQAGGYDLEDEALPEESFVWRSSRDGLLGTGRTLVLPGGRLARGEHRLTLELRDRDGDVGRAERALYVGWRAYLPAASR